MAIRQSQVVANVIRDGTPTVRMSQVIVAALRNGSPQVRMSQVVLEILRPVFQSDLASGAPSGNLPYYFAYVT